jgi:hypothetical protein
VWARAATFGTADFLRGGVTGASGSIDLSLFPGSNVAKRLYDVALVPPVGSPFAAACLSLTLVQGGNEAPITLTKRPVFAGTLADDTGAPVVGASVVAIRTATDRPRPCDAFSGAEQAAAVTQAGGAFSMPLDAGTYTLEFDPPAGAPYPRQTLTGLVVAASEAGAMITRQFQLARGALVEGTVRDSQGDPLPFAGVRFIGRACAAPDDCAGAPPVVEAAVHADADGHYRAVIPAAAP